MASHPGLWQELWSLTSRLSGRILDAGCGNGRYSINLFWAKSQGVIANQVVSLDAARPEEAFVEGVSYAQLMCDIHREPIPFVRADVRHLPFATQSFDSVFCWRVLHHVTNAPMALAEFARVLRPGGLLMVRMPNDSPERRPDDRPEGDYWALKTFWSPKELTQEMEAAGFRLLAPIYIDQTNSMVALGAKGGR